jgi:hypothetical protein
MRSAAHGVTHNAPLAASKAAIPKGPTPFERFEAATKRVLKLTMDDVAKAEAQERKPRSKRKDSEAGA